MKENNMENLTDEELLELAHENMDKADNHLYSSVILSIAALIQALLLIFEYASLIQFLVVYILSISFYLYHKKKTDKYMSIVDKALENLISRANIDENK
jgi:hypothetical protein